MCTFNTRGPRVSHTLLNIVFCRHLASPSLPEYSYPPMGICFGRPATVLSETQPASGAVTEGTEPAPVSLPPIIPPSQLRTRRRTRTMSLPSNIEDLPLSSQIHFKPRGRTMSSTSRSGNSPPDRIARSRTKSAPQPPRSLKSPSPHHPRRRTRSVVRHRRNSRSDSLSTPGEIDGKWTMTP